MDYWEIRREVIKLVPRMTQLKSSRRRAEAVQEKGRKKNYSQFNLKLGEWRKQERLLNTEEINSFLEISARAAACPMPFNMDVWDGLMCPYACIYCYANAFRASLYTAFFDNSKTMGYRHCNPEYYKREMDKMEKFRGVKGEDLQKLNGITKAFAMGIPVRLGIRFEDFLKQEGRAGVSLQMLQYLAQIEYPVMINTKSDIVGRDKYVEALSTNPAKSAVHITAITSNEEITKRLEPGAPSFAQRLEAMKNLSEAGVRVVARIEPFLFLLCDNPEDLDYYMTSIWDAGVRNITFDTYSYTAQNPGIRQSFINVGYDFDRMFIAGCDSQPLGSLLLGAFMDLFRARGFSCSTFDMGNATTNDQHICCEVGDWFEGGFNYGCTVMAARYIQGKPKTPIHWKDFSSWVYEKGGFLTPDLEGQVKSLWNISGNVAYSHRWASKLTPCGRDEDGLVWRYDPETKDYREQLLEEVLG